MPSSQQIFDVGLGLNLVGVPFEAAVVLGAIRASAEGEVAERAQQQVEALGAHAKQAGRHIKEIRAVLAESGLEAPASPQDEPAYEAFVESVSHAIYGLIDEAGERAYLCGWWLGSWTKSANMVAIAAYLKDAAPEDAYLDEVIQSYATQLADAGAGLASCVDGAPGPLGEALGAARALLEATPSPTGAEPLAEAGALQEALEALDAHVAAIRAAV